MKINHFLTFSGPAYVPVSTDEVAARETTAATVADVGMSLYSRTVDMNLVSFDDIEDVL